MRKLNSPVFYTPSYPCRLPRRQTAGSRLRHARASSDPDARLQAHNKLVSSQHPKACEASYSPIATGFQVSGKANSALSPLLQFDLCKLVVAFARRHEATDPAFLHLLLTALPWPHVSAAFLQEAKTAEQSKKAEPAKGRTEKQAEDKATEVKDEAEAKNENVEVEKQGSEIKVIKQGGEQIYIGFDKGAKTKDGRGRIVEDDPSRYPDRTQTTGGWAGGEQGLAAFIEVRILPNCQLQCFFSNFRPMYSWSFCRIASPLEWSAAHLQHCAALIASVDAA